MLYIKPLSMISVKEIVEKSGLSRQTFYRHFEDIYALVLWLFDTTNTATDTFNESKNFIFSVTQSFENIAKQPALYRRIFLHDKDQIFFKRLLRNRIEFCKKQFPEICMEENTLFTLELFWSGYLMMLIRWIESGMKESPEKMTEMVCNSLPENLKTIYQIDKLPLD